MTRMRGRIIGGVLIRRGGRQRRCFCRECRHGRATRAGERRAWRREAGA